MIVMPLLWYQVVVTDTTAVLLDKLLLHHSWNHSTESTETRRGILVY